MSHETVPDWLLERLRLGELPAEEAAAVRRAIDSDQSVRDRLAALDRSDAEIHAAHLPRLVAAGIRARLEAAEATAVRGRRLVPLGLRPALAAAAAVFVLALGLTTLLPSRPGRDRTDDSTDVIRIKGMAPHLVLFRQTPTGAEPLADGALARPNDVIQVLYLSAGRRYGVIVSADGRGVVTQHLPSGEARSTRLTTGDPVALPSAYRLDDAPDWERFYLVTSDASFDVALVTGAVRQSLVAAPAQAATTPPLALPRSLEQTSFTLRKDAR